MDFQEAIRKIEERGDFNRYAEVKPVFEDELKALNSDDHTERGLCYYYLLVSYLKAQLVHETEESLEFFEEMDSNFLEQEKIYKNEAKKFTKGEIQDSYRLMERCYNSLEFLYRKHDFKSSREFAYKRKMRFRKNAYLFNKEYGSYLEYKFLEVTCLYGTSIARWALTVFAFMFTISLAYMLTDNIVAESQRMIPHNAHWFDYFYFSIIILTTVGLGDIVPMSVEGKILVASEAFFGFVMLGVFMGMMQKKL
ncbi:MAG: potassium channel family protein [Candidatus Gracilibacteria bacterium]